MFLLTILQVSSIAQNSKRSEGKASSTGTRSLVSRYIRMNDLLLDSSGDCSFGKFPCGMRTRHSP
jgi:hypothetical protein